MTIRAHVLTCLILGFFAGPVFAQVTTTSDYVTTAEALCMVVESRMPCRCRRSCLRLPHADRERSRRVRPPR